jgi:hypothetical protein
MTIDFLSHLMDFGWFFLGGWIVLLVGACLISFRHDFL